MEINIPRQVIRAHDIQLFFGKGERMSYKMMAEMRKFFKKEQHQPITIEEFCSYYKVKKEDILTAIYLGNKKPGTTNKTTP
ncbi:hypothetical protein [Flavobacterium sp. UBA6135]|uniref:hypothetical protein n=1 Tax=Flavobacterium sp. UBA6135 TaxID=1946553 RepID=UPI0025C128C6|nr:hypothetical protein [Flavobacterium sp. UBA6135]